MLTPLYTVPPATQTTCSSLVVCNQQSGPIAFRIAVAVLGAADDPSQYLFFDTQLSANGSATMVLGITLGPGDVMRVQTDTGPTSFNLFGVEVT